MNLYVSAYMSCHGKAKNQTDFVVAFALSYSFNKFKIN